MKLVKVDKIPDKQRSTTKHNHYKLLDEFIDMGVKTAKIEFEDGDYPHFDSAYTTLHASVRYGGFPVDVVRRNTDIYLVRKDL